MDRLNGAEPFRLKIMFALTDAEKEQKKMEEREAERLMHTRATEWNEFAKNKGTGFPLKRGRGANLAVSPLYFNSSLKTCLLVSFILTLFSR